MDIKKNTAAVRTFIVCTAAVYLTKEDNNEINTKIKGLFSISNNNSRYYYGISTLFYDGNRKTNAP